MKDRLQDLNIGKIIICGAMTHMCIDTTVRAAFDMDFRCIVLSDACAAKKLEFEGLSVEASQVQAAFMAALSGSFVQVIKVNKLENKLA